MIVFPVGEFVCGYCTTIIAPLYVSKCIGIYNGEKPMFLKMPVGVHF